MLLLILFAVVAGAGTAVTPCVLPVLPALLSAAGAGGRRRPFGIVLGLAITFTISIVALASISRGVGLGSGVARTVAFVVLILFGLIMLIPPVAERIQAPLSRLARFGPKTRGDGFFTGIGVGAALGFVCAPCAGPILAAVISVSASGNTNGKVIAIAIAFAAGLSAVLTLYCIGGRKVIEIIRRRSHGGHRVEQVLGVILIATGILIATNLDVKFENALAKGTSGANHSGLLAFIVDPTHGLEDSHAVQSRLNTIRPQNRFAKREQQLDAAAPAHGGGGGGSSRRGRRVHRAGSRHGSHADARSGRTHTSARHTKTAGKRTASVPVAIPGITTPALHNLGPAPAFKDTQDWFNTPGDRPLTMQGLRGKVVLIDFWTYTCINCIRTLPFIEGLYKTYAKYGLVVVGIETPEFTFEQNASSVRSAIQSDGLTYPVVQDNRYGTWDAYQNEEWPADYFIDGHGNVRHTQFGEGDYKEDEAAIRQLLVDNGARTLPPPTSAKAIVPTGGSSRTPETYLGSVQAKGFLTPLKNGTHTYPGAAVTRNRFALKGPWTATNRDITPAGNGAQLSFGFHAQHVYLVMTSKDGKTRTGHVLLDGRPISASDAGSDVHGGAVSVSSQRLYNLVSLPGDETHTLTITLPPGITAYDLTFG